jgi:hypothetical protein
MKSRMSPNRGNFVFSRRKRGVTKALGLLLLAGMMPCASFATTREAITTLSRLWTYPGAGSFAGDVLMDIPTTVTGCHGFWLPAGDDVTKRSYALLLAAYSSELDIRLMADDTQIWGGSGNPYCRLTFVGMIRQ